MSPAPSAEPLGDQPCSSCGTWYFRNDLAVFGEQLICAKCQPGWVQAYRQGTGSAALEPQVYRYAGFWIRFVAQILDIILLTIVGAVIGGLVGFVVGLVHGVPIPQSAIYLAQGLSIVFQFCYYTFCWSHFGATPGKLIVGLKVIDEFGGPVSGGQAVKRWFSQILSGLLLAYGYLKVGWSAQKEALHDGMAGTRVIWSR